MEYLCQCLQKRIDTLSGDSGNGVDSLICNALLKNFRLFVSTCQIDFV